MEIIEKSIRVVILGAGGHAKVIADSLLNPILRRQGFEFVGFLDDNPDLLNQFILGRPVLGGVADLDNVPHDAIVIGIGDNENRCNLFARLFAKGEKFATVIHPSATMAQNVKIGVGSVVFAGVVVNTAADIGDDVILNTSCTIDHDCIVESHAHICPGAHLGGTVHVGKGAWIGIGSTLLHNIGIGNWATVGGGAAVIHDVAPNTTVVGVPAKALPSRLFTKRRVYDIHIDQSSANVTAGESSEAALPNSAPIDEAISGQKHVEKLRANELNVMFTSAGRRVELIRAFRKAYESLQLSGRIVAVDFDPLSPALSMADHPYVVPPLSSPEYIPTLVSICRDEKVRMVFPLIDPDIPLLARHRKVLEETGAEVVVVPEESVAITADKWCTHEFFRRIGVPTAKSWLPKDLNPDTAQYPLFIKPRRGSAGKDSFKVESPDQLRFFTKYVTDPIIEEFLPGPEITNDVLCSLKGNVLAVVSRKRIEVRSGEVAKGVTIYDESISKTCMRIAEALKGKGQITVQCIMKNGAPYFTEINARFGGGTPLGIASGCDSPRWLLAEAAGLPVIVPELGCYKTGLYVTRFDDSFFLTEADRDRIVCASL